MCLSVPAKVVKLEDGFACVDVGGNILRASTALLEEVKVGDYLLVHAGFAIAKYDEEEARKSLAAWEKVSEVSKRIPPAPTGGESPPEAQGTGR